MGRRLHDLRLGRTSAALMAVYGMAGLFRAAQNAAQTSLAAIGETRAHEHSSAVGAVIALSGVSAVAATVLIGRVGRAVGPRVWLGAGLAVTAVSLPVIAAARSAWVLVAGAVLLGFGGGLAVPSMTTLVGRGASFASRRRLAGLTLVLSAALSVGPLLESVILRLCGDSLPVTLAVFSALPAGALLLLGLSDRPLDPAPVAAASVLDGAAPALAVPDAGPGASGVGPGTAIDGPVWKRPGWRLATLAQLLYQFPFVAVVSFVIVAARPLYGLAPSAAELAISAFFATSLLTRLSLTARGGAFRPKRAMLHAGALTAAGVALLGAGHAPAVLFVAMGLLGVPHGLIYPVALGLIAEETPAPLLQHANAAFAACTSAVTVVLPAALGALAAAGGYRVMFTALLVPVGVLATLVIATPSPARWALSPQPQAA